MKVYIKYVYLIWKSLLKFVVLGIVSITFLTGLFTALIQLNPVKRYFISKIEGCYNQTFESELKIGTITGILPFQINLNSIEFSYPYPIGDTVYVHTPISVSEISIRPDWTALFSKKISNYTTSIINPVLIIEQQNQKLTLQNLFKKRNSVLIESVTNDSSYASNSFFQDFYFPEISISNAKIVWWLPEIDSSQTIKIPQKGVMKLDTAQIFVELTNEHTFFDVKEMNLSSESISPNNMDLSIQFYHDSLLTELSRFQVKTDKSFFSGSISFNGDVSDVTLKDIFVEHSEIQVNESRLDLCEWASLFPVLSNYNDIIEFESNIEMKDSQLHIKNFFLDNQYFAINLSGDLTNINDFNNLRYNLNGAVGAFETDKIRKYIPKSISNELKNSVNKGSFSVQGNAENISVQSTFEFDKSTIKTDVQFSHTNFSQIRNLIIKAEVNELNFGAITNNYSGYGKLVRTDIKYDQLIHPYLPTTVHLESEKIQYKNHKIDHLKADARFTDNESVRYEIRANENNSKIDLSGGVNFSKDRPSYDLNGIFTDLNLKSIFKDKDLPKTKLSGSVSFRGVGSNMDTIYGSLALDVNKSIIKDDTLPNHQLYIDLDEPELSNRTLRLTSTFFDFTASGFINFSAWQGWYTNWNKKISNQILDYYLLTSNADSTIKSVFFEEKQRIQTNFKVKDINLLKKYSDAIPLLSTHADADFLIEAGLGQLFVNGSLNVGELKNDNLSIENGKSQFTISINDLNTFRNNSVIVFKNSFDSFELNGVSFKKSIADIQQLNDTLNLFIKVDSIKNNSFKISSKLVFAENYISAYIQNAGLGNQEYYWNLIKEAHVKLDKSKIVEVENLELENEEQLILIDGVFSELETDKVNYTISNLNFKKLSSLLQSNFDFSGNLNGEFTTKTLTKVPQIEGNLEINHFSIMNRLVGDVGIKSEFFPQKDLFAIAATIKLDSLNYPDYYLANNKIKNDFKIDGYVYRPTDKLIGSDTLFYADIEINEADMWILRAFIPPIYSKIEGKASGNGFITGGTRWFDFSTKFNLDNILTVPNFLETEFYMNGPVLFGFHEGVIFDSVRVTDGLGGAGVLTGNIDLGYFSKYSLKTYNLKAEANRLQFLNNSFTTEVPFYGKVAGSGIITLTGPFSKPFLATENPILTTPNSRLSIPLLDEERVETQTKFIEFVKSFNDGGIQASGKTQSSLFTNGSGSTRLNQQINTNTFTELFSMNLQFTAPEQTQFELVFDPVTGEILTANGGGSLNIVLQNQDFGMFGYFDVYGGNYLFMGGDLFSRKFTIKDGGTLAWEGSAQNPRINLTAVYKSRPNIQPLTGNDARLPIDLILKLNGSIEALQNDFYFEIPNTTFQDASINTALRILNSEEQKLPQATSLLLTGNFFAVNAGVNTSNSFGSNLQNNATQTGLSQLLSSQINTILNNSISNLDIDLNLNGFNQADLGIALRLFDDRLVLRRDGQLINNDPNATNQNVIGDLRASYKISRALSVEVFYRQDPSLSGFSALQDQVQNVSGVGLQYQVQFNKWRDLPRIIWNNILNFFGVKREDDKNLAIR
ncbi:MAG: hypothetical protein GW823_01670 [Bacteroidetes bacterium]|nr:hypothetical protein [Bacteroidota bacterium]